MKSNKSTFWWSGGLIILLVFLFLYPRIFGNTNRVSNAPVPCLIPNVPLVQHIHPVLSITVDGKPEPIPAEIGLSASCEHAIHTHDEDTALGVIHVESQDRRAYTLGDFFSVWGKSMNRDGYALKVTADGRTLDDPAALLLKDNQQIKLEYVKTN